MRFSSLVAHRARHAVERERVGEQLLDRRRRRAVDQRLVHGHRRVAAQTKPLDLRLALGLELDLVRHLGAPVRIAERVGHRRRAPREVRRHVVAVGIGHRPRARAAAVAQRAARRFEERTVALFLGSHRGLGRRRH
jgi:hypothetical protein